MALENLTKITSVGISSHIALTGVTTVGFITSADAWVGGALTVGGNITIGGTVTYEDVTNIDSVGIVTAQTGVRVTAGGLVVTAGVSTYSGLVDVNNRIDVVGGANIDQANVSGVSTFAGTIDANNRIDIVGGANIDQANITGILTATTLIGALTTTDACQVGDLTIVNGNPDLRLKDSNHGGNNTEHMIAFQDSSGNNQMNIGSPFGEQHLRIKHGTNELVKIQTDGKVGINTTAPTEILDVRGNLVVVDGNLVVAESIAVNRPRIVLSAPNDGTNYRHLFGANLQVNSSGTFTTPTANISGGGWEYLPANNLNAHGEIRYLSAPDTNATTSTPVERLRIDPDGKIGIGTDAPDTILHLSDSSADTKKLLTFNCGDNKRNNYIGINGNDNLEIGVDEDEEGGSSSLRLRVDGSEVIRLEGGMTGIRQTDPKATLHVKAHDNNWEAGLLLEDNTGDDGWNLHPESSDASFMIGYNDDTTVALASQSATTVVKLHSGGNLEISNGDLKVASGHGIDFSATGDGSGSMTSELLDDYEEGNWTPTYDTSGSSGTISGVSYATQIGKYVKIGKVVYVEGVLKTSAITKDSNGTYDIAGLPYTSVNSTAIGEVRCYLQSSWTNAPDSFDVVANTTRMRARQGIDVGDGGYTTGNTSDFNTGGGNNNRIYFSGSYRAQ